LAVRETSVVDMETGVLFVMARGCDGI
jgi:hypothetical protein